MTSAMVTDFSVQAVSGNAMQKQSANDAGANFADFMQSGSKAGGMGKVQQAAVSRAQDAKAAYQRNESRSAAKIAKKTDSVQGNDCPDAKRASEIAEKSLEAEKECVRKIADGLGVSEEDIEQALSVLGLTAIDLLQQGNMNLLMAQLTGDAPIEIVTDGTLFARMEMLVEQVSDVFEQVAEEFGVTPQELAGAMEEAMAQTLVSQEGSQEEAQLSQVSAGQTDFGQTEAALLQEERTDTVSMMDDAGEKTFDSAKGNLLTENDEVKVIGNESTQMTGFERQETAKESGDDAAESFAQGQHADATAQFVRAQENIPAPDENAVLKEEPFVPLSMQQTRDIIDQIADYVKLHRAQQVTELEMQLNPASLGNIHLQVASKAGSVSAQLIAQDQAVAAALESQLLQVKESLEAQGLKIDAVEVTVASHEFEQNLDREGKQQEERAREAAGKGRRRILDLNELAGGGEIAEEELTDAERLQVEMMRMGGNRLNFRV